MNYIRNEYRENIILRIGEGERNVFIREIKRVSRFDNVSNDR